MQISDHTYLNNISTRSKMRFDKFTIKSQELIQNAQNLVSQYNHQQFEPEHLLTAMLKESEGIAAAMLRKLGVSPDEIAQGAVAA